MTRVAATFDMEFPSRAHHDPAAPDRILDVLRDHGSAASFFVQGRYARAYPAHARRVLEDGHLLGNHSHHHARLTLLTDGGIATDALLAHEALVEVTGHDPRPWFRCPFGDGHDDPRVLEALRGVGYRDVYWTVDSEDYRPHTAAQGLADRIAAEVAAHGDAAVILWHTWPGITADTLDATLAAVEAAGGRFVRLDEPGLLAR